MGRRLPAMVRAIMVTQMAIMTLMMIQAKAWETNHVVDPCLYAKVQRFDSFTYGLAFLTTESFIFNETQLSPCDRRLLLAGSTAQLAMFRPKVDEISLLTLNGTQFNPKEGPSCANTLLKLFLTGTNSMVDVACELQRVLGGGKDEYIYVMSCQGS
ncbi:unnamed protein product [Camellia sinensis]